jgi:arylsulfatase A-like enzyme
MKSLLSLCRMISGMSGIVCAAAFSSYLCAQTSTPPNIVFIMTDDVGYGDIGSYGAPDINTPSIDQLADEGVRFTDFYANGPVCSPTRTGFITGRYQQRYGLETPIFSDEPPNGKGLLAEGNSLPQLLKDVGYETALVGKWHLGTGDNHSPGAHGFDYFFGFKKGYTDYYQHTDALGEDDLWENDQQVHVDGYMTDLITRRSISFIEENANQPFFLSVQYNAAHWPYQVPDMPGAARDNSRHLMPEEEQTSSREDYIAILERADQGIGEIMVALDANGLAENTLVVFTNDNGGEWLSSNAPLFNRKGTVWEGGIRVPAVIRWPGVIPAGQVTGQVGITMDLSATFLAVAGAKVPASYSLEGINLMPVLTNQSSVVERTLFWREGNQANRAVRSGDMKLIMNGGRSFLFNVRDDIEEDIDLTNRGQSEIRKLRMLLDAWEADVNAEARSRGVR